MTGPPADGNPFLVLILVLGRDLGLTLTLTLILNLPPPLPLLLSPTTIMTYDGGIHYCTNPDPNPDPDPKRPTKAKPFSSVSSCRPSINLWRALSHVD